MLNMSSSRSEKKTDHIHLSRDKTIFSLPSLQRLFVHLILSESLHPFFLSFFICWFFVARAKPSAKLVCKTVTNRKRSFCLLHFNKKKFNLILLKHAFHACKKNSFKNKHFFFAAYFESDFIILSFSLQYIKMLKKCSSVLKPIAQNQSSF